MSGPTAAPSGKALALARRRDQAQRGSRAQPPSAGARNAPRAAAPTRPDPAPRQVSVDPVAVVSAAPAPTPDTRRGSRTATALTTGTPTSSGLPSAGTTNNRDLARARRTAQAQTGGRGRPSGRVRPQGPTPVPAPIALSISAVPPPPGEVDGLVQGPAGSGEPVTGPSDSVVDAICSLVDSAPGDAGLPLSVRELCRERRQKLAHQGQAALPAGARGLSAGRGSARVRPGTAEPAVAGRDLARRRRAELGKNGRRTPGDDRPSGRIRPPAPAKVELGTTLSGSPVTGTQLERRPRVTGTEPGTCRAITGTEYIGVEQFDAFCGARPAPPAPKVGESATGQGLRLTGTEVGRSPRVTGDESGSCRTVTGTEYLGGESLAAFCPDTRLRPRPAKVALGVTERKGLAVTGSDEARAAAVTGADAGARRAVTGSPYADAGLSRLTINGPPSKVALTHTLAGRPVSGTEVGRSVKVTGDEAGACRPVSGTEYLSNEQFHTICRTRPEPHPAKVGEDSSRAGQRITGNLVDRSPKVTGNEPGACERVTGSQYVGREQYQAYCEGTPAPRVDKVGVSQTERGQRVSGVMLGQSPLVTGNEPGNASAITGTPYDGGPRPAGAEGGGGGCTCGGACAGTGGGAGDGRAAAATPLAASGLAQRDPAPVAPGPAGFSIVSPARAARGRITGNALGSAGGGGGSRITGPVNLAVGLVSGTPEFRYRDEAPLGLSTPAPVAAAALPQVEASRSRITGEGRDGGRPITGDDWARGGRVTGTEGHWAQGRNLTLRGEGRRNMGGGARGNKDLERPEPLPATRVTGSSGGGHTKGTCVTYSGGARG